jgi:hypothetical protein
VPTVSFGQLKDEDVPTLIARKQYGKAIAVIKAQLESGPPDPRLRLQLADALVLAERDREALMILVPLADEYAREGFAAKAISVLKKIQRLDPDRPDVEAKLAALIETKQKLATTMPYVPRGGLPESGTDEIGFEPLPGGPITVPAAPSERPPHRAPVADLDLLSGDDFAPEAVEAALEGDTLELEPLDEPLSEAPPATGKPAVDAAFTRELLSVIDGLFPATPAEQTPPASSGETTPAGRQLVVSPLFKDFSVDEMVAVIQGLKLLTFERSRVILRQGDPGDRMYMLTSGRVRAFVRNAEGQQTPLADLNEGAFFGEVSILTGKPRNATIVAVTRCELLELERATLDGIVERHPRVRDVLEEFARQRSR